MMYSKELKPDKKNSLGSSEFDFKLQNTIYTTDIYYNLEIYVRLGPFHYHDI